MHHGMVEVLSSEECERMLAEHGVGLVAFVNQDGQQLVPVNYVVRDARDVIFRTSDDSMLASLADGHVDVAFAVTEQAETDKHGWNVAVRGSTTAQDPDELIGAPPQAWAGGRRAVLVRLHAREIDGRRVTVV